MSSLKNVSFVDHNFSQVHGPIRLGVQKGCFPLPAANVCALCALSKCSPSALESKWKWAGDMLQSLMFVLGAHFCSLSRSLAQDYQRAKRRRLGGFCLGQSAMAYADVAAVSLRVLPVCSNVSEDRYGLGYFSSPCNQSETDKVTPQQSCDCLAAIGWSV